MSNPTISQITLPSGTTYDIADLAAREAASLGMEIIKSTDAANTPKGVTWSSGGTTITGTLEASGSTSGKMYLVPVETSDDNDIFAEYLTVTSGTSGSFTYSWEKIGTTDIDLSDLGDLAYKDTASASYTPAGSINVNAASGNGTSYTPEGTVSAPTISVANAGSTASITPFGSAGTLPSLTTTVSNGTLVISFDQGTLPSGGSAVTVKTGDASYSATAPTFSGTEKKLEFSGTSATITVS